MATGMNFDLVNYSGALYTKSITSTPFLNIIGAPRYTNSVEFPINQEYSLGTPTQPAISEKDSLTAPEAVNVTRSQATNVTQIFQYRVAVSYARESNMGQLSGVNIAGQQANPTSELQFQTATAMQKARNDIEYTFINGAYSKAASNDQPNKTRGILEAIVTNSVVDSSAPSSSTIRAVLKSFFKKLYDGNTDIDGYVLMVNSDIKSAISEAYEGSGYSTPGIQLAGIDVVRLMTDYGNINIALSRTMPQDTALCFNPTVIHPVEQPVPGKGNFFLEELSKNGAATEYQIFGQMGLDHGFEKLHGKLKFTV